MQAHKPHRVVEPEHVHLEIQEGKLLKKHALSLYLKHAFLLGIV